MLEVNRARIVRRLLKEGWTNEGGRKHDVYSHPDVEFPAIVPRHRLLSPGVARAIARLAGW
jgi:predicted RNA binding protein YcfA (HicA-like mRNA interferase family)